MNIEEWYNACDDHFAFDMRFYHDLNLYAFRVLAKEANLEDFSDIDVRIYSKARKINEYPFLDFFFQWKRKDEVLYETFLETRKFWNYESWKPLENGDEINV